MCPMNGCDSGIICAKFWVLMVLTRVSLYCWPGNEASQPATAFNVSTRQPKPQRRSLCAMVLLASMTASISLPIRMIFPE